MNENRSTQSLNKNGYSNSHHKKISKAWLFVSYIVGVLCFMALCSSSPVESIILVIAGSSPVYLVVLIVSAVKNRSMVLPVFTWIISVASLFFYIYALQNMGINHYSTDSFVNLYQPTFENIMDINKKSDDDKVKTTELNITSVLLKPGDVIVENSYIDFDGVSILYTGGEYKITNNRDDIIRVSCWIIGTKKDGTFELLGTSGLNGPDMTKYNKDLEENGWAVYHYTNMVRPSETLHATLDIIDVGYQNLPSFDVDGDGYYDIKFVISPQLNEDSIIVSSDDPKTDTYKIPVNDN